MSSITSLGLANPSNKFSQSTIAKFMIRAMGLDEQQATRLRALYRASGIDYRYSVLEDFRKVDGFSFYSDIDGHEPFPSTHVRLELFRKHALQLSKQSALTCLANCGDLDVASITHLVVVSCTGMYAPGLDIDL